MNNSTASHLVNQATCRIDFSTTFTVVLSTVTAFALAGNFFVILAFIRTANLKTSPNYYIVNMAVSDLVCVLLNWPLYATEWVSSKAGGSLITDPTIALLFCKLGIYSRTVSYAVSIWSLVFIAVDRFIATKFPLKALKITGRTRTILLTLSWVCPALGVVPYMFYSKIVKIEHHTFCRNMMSKLALNIYYLIGFVLCYIFPLLLILVLYPLIIKHSRRIRVKDDSGGRNIAIKKRQKQNHNIMKMFGSIVLAFFICWTPLYVYMFLKSLYASIFINDECGLLVSLFYYIFPLFSTAINPFILITLSSSYRGAVKKICRSCLPKRRFGHTASDVSSQARHIQLPELQ